MKLLRSSRGATVGLCIISGSSVFAQGITVEVNGQAIGDQGAQMVRGYVLVPLRDVSEGLGAYVQWDQNTRTITITKRQKTVSMTIGGWSANMGGQPTTLEIAPREMGGTTMVPARFIGEALGAAVNWNPATNTIDFDLPTDALQQTETITTTAALRNQQPQPTQALKFQDDASGWITTGKEVHFTLDSTPGGTATVILPGLGVEIPMQEAMPGHYVASWSESADQPLPVHEATAMAKLSLGGNTYYSATQILDFDSNPPTIQNVIPKNGETISGFKPVITADYMDIGSGIDPTKVSLSFNGQDVTQSAEVTPHFVKYTLPDGLAPGNYKVDLSVTDKAGNTATREWAFSVMGGNDNSGFTHNGDRALRPGDRVKFSLQAVPGSQVTVNIQNGESIPLTETSPGMFSGEYIVRERDLFGGNLVTATTSPPNATPYTIQAHEPMGVSGNISPRSMAPVISSPLASQNIGDTLIIGGSVPAASMVEIHVSYDTILGRHLSIHGSLADLTVMADSAGNFQTKPLHSLNSIEGKGVTIHISATTVLPDGTRSPETTLVLHPRP